MKGKGIVAIALLGISVCAFGQVRYTERLGTVENMNRVKPGMAIKRQDRVFLREAAQKNMLELELGEIARWKGSSEWAREYGEVMMKDHRMGVNEVRLIARKLNLMVPNRLSTENKKIVARLSRLNGAEFDRAYRAEMIRGHNAYDEKLEREIKLGNNSLIRNFAIKSAPVTRLHAKMAARRVTKI